MVSEFVLSKCDKRRCILTKVLLLLFTGLYEYTAAVLLSDVLFEPASRESVLSV